MNFALSHRNSEQAASFCNNIAISYRWLGNLEEARKTALKGIGMVWRKDGLFALLKSSLSDIFFEEGKLKDAETNINEALRILTGKRNSPGEDHWLLSAYTLTGNISVELHDDKKAESYYLRGLELIDKSFGHGRKRERAELYNRLGLIYLSRKKGRRALTYFNESLKTLIAGFDPSAAYTGKDNRLYAKNRLFEAFAGKGDALALSGRNIPALDNYLFALKVGDKTRDAITSQRDKIHYQEGYRELVEKALDIAYNLWKGDKKGPDGGMVLKLVERAKARTLLDEIQKNERQLPVNLSDTLFVRRKQPRLTIVSYETDLVSGNGNQRKTLANMENAVYRLSLLEKEIKGEYRFWQRNPVESGPDPVDLPGRIPIGITVFDYFLGSKTGYNVILEKIRLLILYLFPMLMKWDKRYQIL